jgi:hypothetical protein
VSFWIKPSGEGVILSKTDSQASLRGVDMYLYDDGKIGLSIISQWPDNALKLWTKQSAPAGRWTHVAVAYDGSSKAAGATVYFNGKKQEVEIEADKLTGSFANDQPLRIGKRATDAQLKAALADVRVFCHALSDAEVEHVRRGSVRRGLASAKPDQLDESLLRQFDELLLEYGADPNVKLAAETKLALEKLAAEPALKTFPQRWCSKYRSPRAFRPPARPPPSARQTASCGPTCQPRLPPFPTDARGIGWVSPLAHQSRPPLFAQVAVNRLWQQFFRVGLVKTPDNLGVSHSRRRTRSCSTGSPRNHRVALESAAHSAADRIERRLSTTGRVIAGRSRT